VEQGDQCAVDKAQAATDKEYQNNSCNRGHVQVNEKSGNQNTGKGYDRPNGKVDSAAYDDHGEANANDRDDCDLSH
jgi:hypothetical protein